MKKALFALCSCILLSTLSAQEMKLPKVDTKGGKPLMQCFAQRKTARDFSAKALPPAVLSELFYAADGINRPDGRKTVPTARNKQNQKVYAAMQNGVWLYGRPEKEIARLAIGTGAATDHRAAFGKQPFHKKAPVVLLYVSDLPAVGKNLTEQMLYSGNHSGHAAQNVYLYAASKGLSTVICGMLDRVALKKLLKLNKNQAAIFSQPVGYPAK